MTDYEKNDAAAGYARALSPANDVQVLKTGNLAFIGEEADNGSGTTYQEASGAPIEARSPLGTKTQWFSIIFLNIGQMIGTGVFSTRESPIRLSIGDRR